MHENLTDTQLRYIQDRLNRHVEDACHAFTQQTGIPVRNILLSTDADKHEQLTYSAYSQLYRPGAIT